MSKFAQFLHKRKMAKIEKLTKEQLEQARLSLMELTPLEAFMVFNRYCVASCNDASTAYSLVTDVQLKSFYSLVASVMSKACANSEAFIDGLKSINTQLLTQFDELGFEVDTEYEIYDPGFISYLVKRHGL